MSKTLCLRKKQDIVVYPCNPSYWSGLDKRISVWGQPGKKSLTLTEDKTKQMKAKTVGYMVQVIYHFPNKSETLR
jgi:hypothetical protein